MTDDTYTLETYPLWAVAESLRAHADQLERKARSLRAEAKVLETTVQRMQSVPASEGSDGS